MGPSWNANHTAVLPRWYCRRSTTVRIMLRNDVPLPRSRLGGLFRHQWPLGQSSVQTPIGGQSMRFKIMGLANSRESRSKCRRRFDQQEFINGRLAKTLLQFLARNVMR
jgi:hypothetical protein